MRRKVSFGLAILLLGIAVCGLLTPLPNQYRSPWFGKLLDLGHVPLFATVTVCFWSMVRPRIWLAFCLASFIAVAAEIAQSLTGRSGDILDVLRGLLGALIGVILLKMPLRPFRWRQVALGTVLAIALAAWPVWDCGPTLLDTFWAYRSFPVLSDFHSPWEETRWYTTGACLKRVATIEDGHRRCVAAVVTLRRLIECRKIYVLNHFPVERRF